MEADSRIPFKSLFTFRWRLDSLLLFLTVAAFLVAWWKSKNENAESMRSFEIAASATELKLVPDLKAPHAIRFHGQWTLWVPYGSERVLHFRLREFELSEHTDPTEQMLLAEGIHHLKIVAQDPTTIVVDGVEWKRWEYGPTWRLQETLGTGGGTSIKKIEGPTVLEEHYGSPVLKSDEVYDPKIHRYGLKVWVE